LVNLKRPSLRLCPLAISSGDDSDQVDCHHNHGLEFEYDCDAAKCRINVSVVLPTDHPYAETIDSTGYSCISVFESIVDGGFGKVLHLDEGATLELGRFEHKHTEAETASSQITGVPESSRAADIANSSAPASSRNDRARKRFTGFNFRKRSANTSVSGPALAVVDAEASAPTVEGSEDKESKVEVKDGVRVTIRLSALNEDGTDLSVVNEQITYLHVIRFGAAPDEDKEDTRPWVVEVVKREATVRFVYIFTLRFFYLLFHRLDPTHSTCTRFTVFPLSPPHPLNHRPLLLHRTHILTRPRLYPQRLCMMMSLHLSVYCAFLPHVRSFYFLAATSLLARNVPSIWSNSVQAATSFTPKKPQPQPQAVRLQPQKPQLQHPPRSLRIYGESERQKAGFAPSAVDVSYIYLTCVLPDNPCTCPAYTSLLRISTTPPTKDISDDDHRASIDEHEHEDGEHEHEHEREDEHDDHPLATTPPAPGGMFNNIRSGLMRLSVARSDGGHTAETTENEHPAEVPASIV
jgi:hypothetical protein